MVRQARVHEERMKVDLAPYRVESVVGNDEERGAPIDSSIPDRRCRTATQASALVKAAAAR